MSSKAKEEGLPSPAGSPTSGLKAEMCLSQKSANAFLDTSSCVAVP